MCRQVAIRSAAGAAYRQLQEAARQKPDALEPCLLYPDRRPWRACSWDAFLWNPHGTTCHGCCKKQTTYQCIRACHRPAPDGRFHALHYAARVFSTGRSDLVVGGGGRALGQPPGATSPQPFHRTPVYSRISERTDVCVAVLLGILTTLSYGFLQSLVGWVLARCVWGLAWSLLRLGSLFCILKISTPTTRGMYNGLYNDLYRMGEPRRHARGRSAGGHGRGFWPSAGIQPERSARHQHGVRAVHGVVRHPVRALETLCRELTRRRGAAVRQAARRECSDRRALWHGAPVAVAFPADACFPDSKHRCTAPLPETETQG